MSKDKEAVAEKAPKVEIIRGRMPVQVVKMIRFHSDSDMTKSALADKYRTTVGKINDVMAGNNFGYVNEDFKPSAEQLAAAKEYIAKCDDADLTALVETFEVATEEEVAQFEELRKASRKVRAKKEDASEEGEELEDVDEDDDLVD
jgi:hypothetical protein